MKKEVVINDVTYYVSKPSSIDESNAKMVQSRVFSKAIQEGACLKQELDKVLKRRGVWDETDNKEIENLSSKLNENLEKLEEGGFDIMEARKLAIETNDLRTKLLQKLGVLRQHNSLTAEGQADDAYFDALVAYCCYKEDGTKVFKSYDDYLSKSHEDYANKLAQELKELIYGGDDYLRELPENKFLMEYGFLNEELEFINENGEKVDIDYQKVEEEEPKKERKPFLRNGEPIVK